MRVLIIEDEHKIAGSLKKGLEQETYSVDVSYDGSNGYDMASTEDYDIILLDWMLPKMDGVEICKKLRENNIHTPILMLTAKSELEDKLLGLNIGADDYITKPFAFEELLARIKAILRRPKQTISTILSCDTLELNTSTFNVTRTGKSLKLSKKEYALVEYLLRNKNKIVTKEQIISHVWDYDADILDNTVEQYMGYVRSKIDKVFPKSNKLIHTVRGFGYMLGDREKNV
ncbi:MAG: Two component transcriptional regulator, winged helix family [uncultured bacterium]|nr:MAG: Two component transcriptional regulator, winged helix family [uncultured bacterium]